MDGKVELLYIDETGMSCQPNVQRSWSPLGQPHCMDASSSNRRVNVLGALDWGKKKLNYRLHEGSTCRTHYTQFLDARVRQLIAGGVLRLQYKQRLSAGISIFL